MCCKTTRLQGKEPVQRGQERKKEKKKERKKKGRK
jgi:hypothetical protein